jgi:hypothetical protein
LQEAWAIVVWSKVAWLRMQVIGAACEEEQEGCLAGIAGLRHAKRHDAVVAPRGPMESWMKNIDWALEHVG